MQFTGKKKHILVNLCHPDFFVPATASDAVWKKRFLLMHLTH